MKSCNIWRFVSGSFLHTSSRGIHCTAALRASFLSVVSPHTLYTEREATLRGYLLVGSEDRGACRLNAGPREETSAFLGLLFCSPAATLLRPPARPQESLGTGNHKCILDVKDGQRQQMGHCKPQAGAPSPSSPPAPGVSADASNLAIYK